MNLFNSIALLASFIQLAKSASLRGLQPAVQKTVLLDTPTTLAAGQGLDYAIPSGLPNLSTYSIHMQFIPLESLETTDYDRARVVAFKSECDTCEVNDEYHDNGLYISDLNRDGFVGIETHYEHYGERDAIHHFRYLNQPVDMFVTRDGISVKIYLNGELFHSFIDNVGDYIFDGGVLTFFRDNQINSCYPGEDIAFEALFIDLYDQAANGIDDPNFQLRPIDRAPTEAYTEAPTSSPAPTVAPISAVEAITFASPNVTGPIQANDELITDDFTIRMRFRVLEVIGIYGSFELVRFVDNSNTYPCFPNDPNGELVCIVESGLRVGAAGTTQGRIEPYHFLRDIDPNTVYQGSSSQGGRSDEIFEWGEMNEVQITRYASTGDIFVWVNGRSLKINDFDTSVDEPFFNDNRDELFRVVGPNTQLLLLDGADVELDFVEIYNRPRTWDELN